MKTWIAPVYRLIAWILVVFLGTALTVSRYVESRQALPGAQSSRVPEMAPSEPILQDVDLAKDPCCSPRAG